MRTSNLCLLGFLIVLAGCGDAPKPTAAGPAGRGIRPASLAERVAASMTEALQQTLEARADARMLAAMSAAEEVEILALHPWSVEELSESDEEEEREMAKRESFHGYPILGRKTLSDPADRERIVTLVAEGIARSDEEVAECFYPRHGLRIRGAGHSIDLVICYECIQMHVHGLPAEARSNANTTDAVEPRVSAFFREHGLEISEN